MWWREGLTAETEDLCAEVLQLLLLLLLTV
jgi:hypothetical protein